MIVKLVCRSIFVIFDRLPFSFTPCVLGFILFSMPDGPEILNCPSCGAELRDEAAFPCPKCRYDGKQILICSKKTARIGCFILVVIILLVLGAAYLLFIHDGGLGKLITRTPLPPAQLPLALVVLTAVPAQPPVQGIGPFAASVLPVESPDQNSSIISHKGRDPQSEALLPFFELATIPVADIFCRSI